MIDKLKLCAEVAGLHTDKVVIGDQTIHNLRSESHGGTVCFIGLPKSKKTMNVEIVERSYMTLAIMKRSVLDESIDEELNILSDCEKIMNVILSTLRCKADSYNLTADVVTKLMETDNKLSGIEATITFEPL